MDIQKIILIEDDAFIHDLYRDTLTRSGYNVVSGKDGQEAIDIIKANTDASLILLDLMLPKINGIDVLREIKKNESTKNLAAIVLTNLSEEETIKQALELGANAYLVKVDYTPQEIIEMVKQYIDLKAHLKKDSL